MRVLVTGTSGQVARALARRARSHGVEVLLHGRPELDLERPESIAPILAAARPDIVVNAAAYTSVDRAETEEGRALAVNQGGAAVVARATRRLGIPVVQLSTDYVFGGHANRPFREDDATGPLNVYGRTKLSGEQEVARGNPDHAIVRLAWIYSPFGTNFVKTMLRLAQARSTISVVADQLGSPSSAFDVADGLLALCRNLLGQPGDGHLRGTFHMTAAGYTSWADFARAVFSASKGLGGPFAEVIPIASSDFPTAALRPLDSRLDCSKLRERHAIALPDWRASVDAVVGEILRLERDQ